MQIPLSLKLADNKSFDTLIGENNHTIVKALFDFLQNTETLFYIHGNESTGKTHLLESLHSELNKNQQSSVLLRSNLLSDRSQVSLLELFDIILLDDIHLISGNSIAEENLFIWINEAKQNNKKLIVASRTLPDSSEWTLPDLISRLQSAQRHKTQDLNRNDLIQMFSYESKNKGMKVDEKALKYIENNCPMNPSFILSLLYHLDNITLSKKKQVTVPLIKQIINSNLVN